MAHEIAAELELSAKLVARGEFNAKARLGQRLDARLPADPRRAIRSGKTRG